MKIKLSNFTGIVACYTCNWAELVTKVLDFVFLKSVKDIGFAYMG